MASKKVDSSSSSGGLSVNTDEAVQTEAERPKIQFENKSLQFSPASSAILRLKNQSMVLEAIKQKGSLEDSPHMEVVNANPNPSEKYFEETPTSPSIIRLKKQARLLEAVRENGLLEDSPLQNPRRRASTNKCI